MTYKLNHVETQFTSTLCVRANNIKIKSLVNIENINTIYIAKEIEKKETWETKNSFHEYTQPEINFHKKVFLLLEFIFILIIYKNKYI